MAVYAIGDVHGHFDQLMQLLANINYQEKSDELWFVGDFINRGNQSLETLRFIAKLGSRAKVVIGNHDFSLMVQGHGLDKGRIKKTVSEILKSKDADDLVEYLCQLPLMVEDVDRKIIMTHAGMYPLWSVDDLRSLNYKYCEAMKNKKSKRKEFLQAVYRNGKGIWNPNGKNIEQMCFAVNACTRMRYLNQDFSLDFDAKMPPSESNYGLISWFDKLSDNFDWKLVFGHWAALGLYVTPFYACIDGGAAWNGNLVAFDLDRWEIAASVSCLEKK